MSAETASPIEYQLLSTLHLRANAPWLHASFPNGLPKDMPKWADAAVRPGHPDYQEVRDHISLAVGALANVIHEANVARGWWTHPETGEFLVDRNVGEMLMLMVTEISEAYHGFTSGACDDKLTQHHSAAVELADALIRMFDTAGRLCPNLGDHFTEIAFEGNINSQPYFSLITGINFLSDAMEHHRKGLPMDRDFANFLLWALRLAHYNRLLICEAFRDKLAYNKVRADHDLENRRKEGGKKV